MDKTVLELKSEIEDFYLNAMIDQGSYINFLDTMANFHKYNLEEQINIFNNAPQNSVAVASENIWKRLGRTIKRNATPIPIIKTDGATERVEYVYDTSDTNEYNPKEVLLWQIDEELDKEYLDANLQGEGSVENRVKNVCKQMSAGFDGSDIEKNILGLSLSYVTLKRMGYDVTDILNELITTQWELTNPEKLLTQVNTDAKSILNPLGTYIRNGRTKANDRSRYDNGAGLSRGRDGRNDGELGNRGELRTMGDDQKGISDRGKERNVEEPSSGRESGKVSERLSGEIRGEVRENIRRDDEERRSDGEIESRGFDGLDSEGTTGENSGDGDNNSGNQRDDVISENTEQKSVQIGHNDEVENISENREEPVETYIIRDVYSNFNDDGDLETNFIAYNSIEVGEKIIELTGSNTFLEFKALAEKHSGYFQPSPDDDIPAHFSFKTEEDRDAFAVEANVVINNVLNLEFSKDKEDKEQKEESKSETTEKISEENSVQIGHIDEGENTPNSENESVEETEEKTISEQNENDSNRNEQEPSTVADERNNYFVLDKHKEGYVADPDRPTVYNATLSEAIFSKTNFEKTLTEIAEKHNGWRVGLASVSLIYNFENNADRRLFVDEASNFILENYVEEKVSDNSSESLDSTVTTNNKKEEPNPILSLFPDDETTTDTASETTGDVESVGDTENSNENDENTEENSVQIGHIDEEENSPISETKSTVEPSIQGTIEEKGDNFTLTFTTEEQRYDNYGDLYYNAYPSKKVLRVANFKTLDEIAKKHSGSLWGESFLSFDSKNDRTAFIEEVNELVKSKEIDLSSINYDADMSTTSGKREVFKRNIAAIRLMKELEDEKREATPEEAKLLQSYAGFGGMPEAFDSFNTAWSEEYHILLSELSTKEFDEARNSTLNAHYTPDAIVQSIYEGLSSLGFENGYILDKRVANLIQTYEKETAVKVLEIKPFTAVSFYLDLIL